MAVGSCPMSLLQCLKVHSLLLHNLQVASSFKQDRAPLILQDLIDQATPSGAAIRFYVSLLGSEVMEKSSQIQFHSTDLEHGMHGKRRLILMLGHQDYVAPNTFFYVSSRVRNPPATPASNYWYFYVQQLD